VKTQRKFFNDEKKNLCSCSPAGKLISERLASSPGKTTIRDQGPEPAIKSVDTDTSSGAESTGFWQDGAQVPAEEGTTEVGATSGNANVSASYGRLSREGLQWKSVSARLQQLLLSQ